MVSAALLRVLWWSLRIWRKEKFIRTKNWWIGRLFQYGDVPLAQEMPYAQGVVSRCIILMKHSRFVWLQLSSLLANWAKDKTHGLKVLIFDRLALWQEFTRNDAPQSKDMIKMTDIWLLLAFFGFCDLVGDYRWLFRFPDPIQKSMSSL